MPASVNTLPSTPLRSPQSGSDLDVGQRSKSENPFENFVRGGSEPSAQPGHNGPAPKVPHSEEGSPNREVDSETPISSEELPDQLDPIDHPLTDKNETVSLRRSDIEPFTANNNQLPPGALTIDKSQSAGNTLEAASPPTKTASAPTQFELVKYASDSRVDAEPLQASSPQIVDGDKQINPAHLKNVETAIIQHRSAAETPVMDGAITAPGSRKPDADIRLHPLANTPPATFTGPPTGSPRFDIAVSTEQDQALANPDFAMEQEAPESDIALPTHTRETGQASSGQAGPVRTPDMARAIAGQLSAAISVRSGSDTIEVALNPQELGRVSIALSGRDDGIVLSISAERPETLDLMRRHVLELSSEFRELGYKNISLDFGMQSEQHHERHQDPAGTLDIQDNPDDPQATDLPTKIVSQGVDLRY